jgi:hypothetical protein
VESPRAGRWTRTPVPSTLTPTPSLSHFTSSPYRFFRFDLLFYTLVRAASKSPARCSPSLLEMQRAAPPDLEGFGELEREREGVEDGQARIRNRRRHADLRTVRSRSKIQSTWRWGDAVRVHALPPSCMSRRRRRMTCSVLRGCTCPTSKLELETRPCCEGRKGRIGLMRLRNGAWRGGRPTASG